MQQNTEMKNMQGSQYSANEDNCHNNYFHLAGYDISTLQATGIITFITDPSGANIYIDGVLQSVKTSTSIIVPTGNRTITFTKAGYNSYSEVVSGLKGGQVKVCAILGQTTSIIDSGIVICTTPNISSCPISPITCPTSVNPLDYINFIAILNSTVPTTLTVRFIYMIDNIINNTDVSVNLIIGTNIVYAFPTNIQYPVSTISLEDVILI